MLKSELIRPRLEIREGQVRPRRLPADYRYLAMASELAELFQRQVGRSWGALGRAPNILDAYQRDISQFLAFAAPALALRFIAGASVQRAAGHASLTTTQRYLHLVDRMMEEALEENALLCLKLSTHGCHDVWLCDTCCVRCLAGLICFLNYSSPGVQQHGVLLSLAYGYHGF